MSPVVVSPELIDKYIGGACNPDERKAVESWYLAMKDKPGSAMELEWKNQLESKMQLLGQIRTNIQHSTSEIRNKRMKVLLYCWLVSAVAVALFLFWALRKT